MLWAPVAQAEAPAVPTKPSFQFYDILPELEVVPHGCGPVLHLALVPEDDALVELEKALALKPGHEPSLQLRKELLGEKEKR